jgi:hypothetical protein
MPKCYKVPNRKPGGVVSVPWLSNDLNLVFYSGYQSSFTFCATDPLRVGFIAPRHIEYWKSLVSQYVRQTRYNKIVPLVIEMEYGQIARQLQRGRSSKIEVLGELFRYLHQHHIRVVSEAAAVRAYRAAYPVSTPPTYAIFNNLGSVRTVRHPLPTHNYIFRLIRHRIRRAPMGPSFNGFYATTLTHGQRLYYNPFGKRLWQHGQLLVYYDVNGQLFFAQGHSAPICINNYFDITSAMHHACVLPELSWWYNTQKYMPKALIRKQIADRRLHITVTVPAPVACVVVKNKMPYGVMLWGDYSMYQLPHTAPRGSRILGHTGLFLPIVLTVGRPASLSITLPEVKS